MQNRFSHSYISYTDKAEGERHAMPKGGSKGSPPSTETPDGLGLKLRCTVCIDARESPTMDVGGLSLSLILIFFHQTNPMNTFSLSGVHIRIASRWLPTCMSTPNVLSADASWRTLSYVVNGGVVDDEKINVTNGIEKGGFMVREWTHLIEFPVLNRYITSGTQNLALRVM